MVIFYSNLEDIRGESMFVVPDITTFTKLMHFTKFT